MAIGHRRQKDALSGSKSCRPGSAPHKLPGRDERLPRSSDPSNTSNERTVLKKKKRIEVVGGLVD